MTRLNENLESSQPHVFGRYLLLQRLSRGGMGEIFLARHGMSGFEKLCVIKKVLPHLSEDEQFIRRFIDEAQVAIKLQHRNIAQVFEVGRLKNEYFLALEYIEGRDLRRTFRFMAEKQIVFPPELALFIVRELASGLSYAHRRTDNDGRPIDLVHCDISPPNIVISFEGEIKIIDFGIAKSAMASAGTDPKIGFGKFGYMAPEQMIRGSKIDLRTDIYATGVILFELLTGQRLYIGGDKPDFRALAKQVARGKFSLPSNKNPELKVYDAIVKKCLTPDPQRRFTSAAELRDTIQKKLVEIAPTISSDDLSDFMKKLFREEVRKQKNLSAKLEATDIQRWEEEMTMHGAQTVSFAIAITSPKTLFRATDIAADNETPLERPASLADTSFPTSGKIFTGLGDNTEVMNRSGFGSRRLRRWLVSGVAVVGGAFLAAQIMQTFGTNAPSHVATQIDASVYETAGEPIFAPADAAPPDSSAIDAKKEVPLPHKKNHTLRQKAAKTPKIQTPTTANPRARLRKKLRALNTEYQKFKRAYGAILGGEWAELMTFAQYALNNPSKHSTLEKKIRRFRAQMQRERK